MNGRPFHLAVAPSNGPHGSEPVWASGPAPEDADLAVVVLHGRGGSPSDALRLGRAIASERALVVAPAAARSTWYPQRFLAPLEANEPWLSSALERVDSTVEELGRRGLGPARIVVAGFSQGACLATEAVARRPAPWAGLVAWTGGRIGPPGHLFDGTGDFSDVPVGLFSGDPDPHVPWSRVEETADWFRERGADVTTRRYPGRPHTMGRDEIVEARDLVARAVETSRAPPAVPPASTASRDRRPESG